MSYVKVNIMNFDKPNDMARATHYGNNYYEVYSKKLKRIVRLFSSLEYTNFLTLEINPSVISFVSNLNLGFDQ